MKSAWGWFEDAVKRAKPTDYQRHYCNRHTFASRLVMAGVDLRKVGELMGHQTFQMKMMSAHLAPDHRVSAVDKQLRAPEQVQAGSKQQGREDFVNNLSAFIDLHALRKWRNWQTHQT
ncbi:MAG: tyrosine-type recombinase/integrase [Terracidiphilus sp.]